ncbi:MAG: hypothetical protein HQL78_08595 [Magnetococcales bacterium]|nr:hypothetical protein [Magnetococcales bacterium]
MYIRTTKRKKKDGSVVEYYQLAHNERHPETKVPTQQIIYNFGRADQVDRDAMIRLCASLAKVCGIEVKVPSQKNEQNNSDVIGLPDGMELIKTFELGTVTVIEALWERLGIGKIMREKMLADGCTVPYPGFRVGSKRLGNTPMFTANYNMLKKNVYLQGFHEFSTGAIS